MTERVFDVAIVGSGPAGASLALGLARKGLETVIIDARDPAVPSPHDGRNFALVSGSWHLLRGLGLTDRLAPHAQPLHGLEAVDGGSHWFGQPRTLFEDEDLGSPDPDETLGQMVAADQLQVVLDAAISETTLIESFAPAEFRGLEVNDGGVRIALADSRSLAARLIVGADGVESRVREALAIDVVGRDYGKSVFTANVKLDTPHQGIARQLFLPEGPFAILPLPGDRANLAWYLKRGAAEALASLSPAEINAELNQRLSGFAGQMALDGPAGSYPLILQLATEIAGARGVLIGDASRRINPLAGQGLNQGFRDVGALMDCLDQALATGQDIGSDIVLAQFSQARRLDGNITALALDGIDRLFSNDHMLTKPLRGIGMFAVQNIPSIRKFLARKASATEDGVPEAMRGW